MILTINNYYIPKRHFTILYMDHVRCDVGTEILYIYIYIYIYI